MGRKKKELPAKDSLPSSTQSTQGTQGTQSTQGRTQISWAGALDIALAMLMKDNWAGWGSGRSKMELCRKWAAKLGISQQDPNGDKTKAHVTHLCSLHAKAREFFLKSSGGGTTIREYKVGSKIVREELTFQQQLNKICLVFEILDNFLGIRASIIMGPDSGVGLGTNGLQGELTLEADDDNEEALEGDQNQSVGDSTETERTIATLPIDPFLTDELSSSSEGNLAGSSSVTIGSAMRPIAGPATRPATGSASSPIITRTPLAERVRNIEKGEQNEERQGSVSPQNRERSKGNVNEKKRGLDELDISLSDGEKQEQVKKLKNTKPYGMKGGTRLKIAPGKARGQSQSALGGLEDMLNLTSDTRAQKFKLMEMKVKARIVKLGGGSDEQRQHELQLAKLQAQMKKYELDATHELRMKELELKKAELELRAKQHTSRSRSHSHSHSHDHSYYNSRSRSCSRSRSHSRSSRSHSGSRSRSRSRSRSHSQIKRHRSYSSTHYRKRPRTGSSSTHYQEQSRTRSTSTHYIEGSRTQSPQKSCCPSQPSSPMERLSYDSPPVKIKIEKDVDETPFSYSNNFNSPICLD